MRVACSFVLSGLLAFSNGLQSAQQSKPDDKDKQPVQKQEAAPLKQPLAFGLEDGTPIKLRLTRNLSSADATTGDRVDFEVLQDVKVKDVIVVPRGGLALATIPEAQHKRRMARGGKLNVNIDDVRLADGEKAPLRAVKETQGGGHTGAMTGGIVATPRSLLISTAIFRLTRRGLRRKRQPILKRVRHPFSRPQPETR